MPTQHVRRQLRPTTLGKRVCGCFVAFSHGRALIYGSPVPGWNSLIVPVYFIGGIIGINHGKSFVESKKRSLHITRQAIYDE